MCSKEEQDILKKYATRETIEGKIVIELGSRDVNGSNKAFIQSLNPRSYTGIDVEAGPSVDMVLPVEHLFDRFQPESVDVVITMAMIEHVEEWRRAIKNMKAVLKKDGLLLLETARPGFPYHGRTDLGFDDYWRFKKEDMERIFEDLEIIAIEEFIGGIPCDHCIFVAARKRTGIDLDKIEVTKIKKPDERKRS